MTDLKPTPKVAAGGVTGLAAGVLVFIVKTILKVDLPEEVAIAAVGVATWLGSYLKKDKTSPKPRLSPDVISGP